MQQVMDNLNVASYKKMKEVLKADKDIRNSTD